MFKYKSYQSHSILRLTRNMFPSPPLLNYSLNTHCKSHPARKIILMITHPQSVIRPYTRVQLGTLTDQTWDTL